MTETRAAGRTPPGRARRGPHREWPDRERRLLDELEAIFFREGFAHLSVAGIAARLRVSKSTLYRIAPGREKLVELVIDRMFRHMGRQARDAAEGAGDPADRVAAYLGAGTAAVRAGSLAFSRDLEGNPGTRAVYDRHQAADMDFLAGLIDEGVRSGRFRPVPAALVIQVADAARARLRDPAVLGDLGMTHADAIGLLTGILLEGIAGDGSARPPPRPPVPGQARSNSPLRAPSRKQAHSCGLYRWTGPFGFFESRTAVHSCRWATSTQPLEPLLA